MADKTNSKINTLVSQIDAEVNFWNPTIWSGAPEIQNTREAELNLFKKVFTSGALKEGAKDEQQGPSDFVNIFGDPTYFSIKLDQISLLKKDRDETLKYFLTKILTLGSEVAYHHSNFRDKSSYGKILVGYFEQFLRFFPDHKLTQKNVLGICSYNQQADEGRTATLDQKIKGELRSRTNESLRNKYGKRPIVGEEPGIESYVDMTTKRISELGANDLCCALYFVNTVFDETVENAILEIDRIKRGKIRQLSGRQAEPYSSIVDHLIERADKWLKRAYHSLETKKTNGLSVAGTKSEYSDLLEQVKKFAEGLLSLFKSVDNSYGGIIFQPHNTDGLDSFEFFKQNASRTVVNMEEFLKDDSINNEYRDKIGLIGALEQNRIPITHLADDFFKHLKDVIVHSKVTDLSKLIEFASIDLHDYVIVNKISEGGYSLVYLALEKEEFSKEPGQYRSVAVKIPKGTLTSSHAQQEADAIGGVDNILVSDFQYGRGFLEPRTGPKYVPNYYQLIDIKVGSRKTKAMIYEFIDGKDLSKLLATVALDTSQRINLFVRCVEAIAYLHTPGNYSNLNSVVHKDIRPSNFIISERNERIYVIDFSLSSSEDYKKREAGKREYIPPEFFEGERVTKRGDVYSLGITGYEILTGELPYDLGQGVHFKDIKITEEMSISIVFPHQKKPEIPECISTTIMKCLSRNPQDRYDDAVKLLDDLKKVDYAK